MNCGRNGTYGVMGTAHVWMMRENVEEDLASLGVHEEEALDGSTWRQSLRV